LSGNTGIELIWILCMEEREDKGRNTKIETKAFITWLEDDVVHTKAKPGKHISLEEARANTDAVNTFYLGEKLALLVDLTELHSIDKAARDHFSMRGRKTNVGILAILTKTEINRFVGNFYILFSRPVVPTKLFTDEASAIEWLKATGAGPL